MTEAKQTYPFSDGGHGISDENGQKPPIAELTAEMIFVLGTGFALTPFGQRMQAVLMDDSYINTEEPSAVKIRELQAQIARRCEEIGVDPTSFAAKKQQFSALVKARQKLMGEQWHAFSIGRR